MMTGHVDITSDSLVELGKYPSELDWSSLGNVLGFISYRSMHRPSYAMCGDQWPKRSWVKGKTATNGEKGANQGVKWK